MTGREVVESASLRLVQMTIAQAVALDSGSPLDLTPGVGWPRTDTLGAVRMALASGDPASLPWVIIFGADHNGLIIGDVGCKGSPTPDGKVEIGYALAAHYRAQGLGTRAIGRFVEWLLDQPEVSRVTAQTDPDNTASRRLLERLGFVVASVDDSGVWYVLSLDPKTSAGRDPTVRPPVTAE